MNLSSNTKFRVVAAAATAGTSAVTGSEVDMAGWDGVLFLATIDTYNSGNYMVAQQDTATGMGSAADLLGTKVVAPTSGGAVWIDLYKPTERFVRAVITRTASSTSGTIWAIQYQGQRMPEAVANVIAASINGELHVSPAEGTA